MSDSEDASTIPSDANITVTLKRVVARTFDTDRDNLSVKTVRAAIEKELGLPSNWLKSHDVWKKRSSDLTTSEFERLDHASGEGVEDEEPVTKKPQRSNGNDATKGPAKKRKSPADTAKSTKTKPKPRKKSKVSSDEEEKDALQSDTLDSIDEEQTAPPMARRAVAAAAPATSRRSKSTTVIDSDDEDEENGDVKMADAPGETARDTGEGDEETEATEKHSAPAPNTNGNDSDSSLSSVLDEPPGRRKRQKKLPATKISKPKAAAKSKPAAKKDVKDSSPDDEEIKRLQGWLLKCGIRKVWGKELKPFDTSKAKIAHLKGMLADAGMAGRYSMEKARQIKEQRELAADLEAVTDFDKKWGQKEDGARRGGARDLGLDPSLLDGSDDDE